MTLTKGRSYDLGLLKRPNDMPQTLENVDFSILSDTIVYWVPYPYGRKPIPFRVNSMMKERCRLIEFTLEVNHLLLSEGARLNQGVLWESSEKLSQRMQEWYDELPVDLLYSQTLPAGLFDFQ